MTDIPQETAKKQRGRPFKQGQSGNPNGRPKKTPELLEVEELCRQLSPEAVRKIAQWMRHGDGPVSLKAAEGIINRGFGKPAEVQKVTLTDERYVMRGPDKADDADDWLAKSRPH